MIGQPAVLSTTWLLLAVSVFCIFLWITTPVPPAYTGAIGVGLVGLVLSTEVALVGFTSPATWLIVFGLIVGEATTRSGLAQRFGRVAMLRVPGYARTEPRLAFRWVLLALSSVALGLTFLLPSSLVRILLLLPVLERAGQWFDSPRARTGLILGPALTTFYSSAGLLTAGLPNVITTGILEAAGGPSIGWTEWALLLFPVMGLARAGLIVGVTYYLYRPDPGTNVALQFEGGSDPGSDAWRMLAFLGLGVTVWVTDAVHGLHPMYGALLVAVLSMAPRYGVLSIDDLDGVDFSIVFFIGAVFAIGEGLRVTGVAGEATRRLLGVIPTGSLSLFLVIVFCVTVLLSFVMEGLAVASVLTPVLVSFADASGMPSVPVVMIEAIALSTYFFPYQSAVLVTILTEDIVESRELIRLASLCSLTTIVGLLPVQVAILTLAF